MLLTAGAILVLIVVVVLVGRLDFPGWLMRGLARLVPEGRQAAYTPEEIEELRNRIGSLEGQNAILQELINRLQGEAAVVAGEQVIGYERALAQVVYRDHSRLFDTAIIDRGSADGVEEGMPVVDASGLVGRVVAVRAAVSRIVLVTSPDCSFGVIDQRSRELGVVRGSEAVRWHIGAGAGDREVPPDVLKLEYLSPSADISVHDTLVTSGLSGITPPGIRVGEVIEIVSHAEQGTFDIRVRPFADVEHLQAVAVLLYQEEERGQIEELVEEAGGEVGPPEPG